MISSYDEFFWFGRCYLLSLPIVTIKFILIIMVVMLIHGDVVKWDYKSFLPLLEEKFYMIKDFQL